jgi:hypothetical protein
MGSSVSRSNVNMDVTSGKLARWEFALISGAIVLLLGSLFHFIYDWSNESPGVAWLGAINESIWEHMKLLYWPFIIMTIILFFLVLEGEVLLSRSIGLVTGLATIPVLFYLYTLGNIDNSILAVDILIFVISIALAELVSWSLSKKIVKTVTTMLFGAIISITLGVLFITFSYEPPDIFLWEEPN